MGFWTLRVRGKGFQRFVGDAKDTPLGEHVGADAFVEGDGGRVPGKDVPLQARAAFGNGDLGKVLQQGAADSLPSVGGSHEDIFQAEAVMAAPGTVAGEEEGEAGRSLIQLSDHAAKAWDRAEAVAQQVGFGGEDGVRFALIQGELANEAQDRVDVLGGGGTDVQGGAQLGFSGLSGESGLSAGSGGGAGFLAGFGWASSHLSKGRVKAKSSCFLPFGSV